MQKVQKTLPFFFVFAIVSLYSSMTCLKSSAQAAPTPVVAAIEPTENSPVRFANVASPQSIPVPQENTTPTNSHAQQKTVVAFLKKLRNDQISWTQMPTPRPQFIKGIYLTNATAVSTKSLTHFVKKSREHGINTMVIDAQGRALTPAQMSLIKSNGIYPIARIVCFDLGLKSRIPDAAHLDKIMAAVERAAKSGFREIQLDYIRYADEPKLLRLPLKFKYGQIGAVLARARKVTDALGVELGADVFGRITLNENDQIGQRLEIFGTYVHNLYPMVYPSHYYGDNEKIADPYGTVKEGVENSKERIPQTRIIPWIQGFGMKIKPSGLTLPQYVLKQFYAVDDAKGDGYVVWNARNDYSATWKALKEYERRAGERKANKKI